MGKYSKVSLFGLPPNFDCIERTTQKILDIGYMEVSCFH